MWLNISKLWSCHSWWKVPFEIHLNPFAISQQLILLNCSDSTKPIWFSITLFFPNHHDHCVRRIQTTCQTYHFIEIQLDLTDGESDHLIIRKSIAMALWVVGNEVEDVILRISFLHFSCSTTQAHYFKWLSWFSWNGNGKVRSDTNEIIRWDKRYRWDRQVRLEIQVR